MISLFLLLLPEVLEAEHVGPRVFQNDFKSSFQGNSRPRGSVICTVCSQAIKGQGQVQGALWPG